MDRHEQQKILFGMCLRVTLEESDEESSDESDSAEIVNIINDYYERIPKVHCQNYIENVVWQYTDNDFKSHFRLSRQTFIFLLELLSPQLSKQSEGCGRYTISSEKTLLLAIWMMATPNSYRCVADRFGVGKGTAWRSVQKVVHALYSHLNAFIKWPDAERADEISTYIKNKYKFPKVIVAIDGTHVKIAAPKLHADAYINRKGYHSIQVQDKQAQYMI
ncbi:PREDICTED: putative nuclease HARBI1 [Cyphomyrmex costatus]|uniref:putative nuclease HARBI1 n=1 Tax=Cyphomyrmex costatus TaxID=456900 RepID=UPI0008522A71|nr:PREDICTED: putative nuclease HARBI1 [Cyphomyrmex costatus]